MNGGERLGLVWIDCLYPVVAAGLERALEGRALLHVGQTAPEVPPRCVIFDTSGDEAIHCILDTMYAKAPYTVLKRAMHIHPTVAEFYPTILGTLEPLV